MSFDVFLSKYFHSMKKLIIFLAIAFALVSCSQPAQETFTNPIVFSDIPDPCVTRVGDTFYMVSTTMQYSPGCPVMISKDLVNWKIVNYVYDRLEEDDQRNLANGQNDYGNGSWAANIRYDRYEGRFYVIFTCNTTGKSYIFTTEDAVNGEWTRSEVAKCYDPGFLFVDTGSECEKYIVNPSDNLASHEAYIRSFTSDAEGRVTLGEPRVIIDHCNVENPAQGLRAEGFHGYKIGEWYYIFMIQGHNVPGGWQRQQIVWRSKTMDYGTWEVKRILTGNIVDSAGNEVLPTIGVAQGGIVDTPSGDWYAFLFQDNGAVGRSPVVIPVSWEDGWPVLGESDQWVPYELPLPVQGQEKTTVVASDEFNHSENELLLEWQWNHNPDNSLWSFTEREGYLRLKSGHIAPNIQQARNSLTQRTMGPVMDAVTVLETAGLKEGDYAGISAFQNRYAYLAVTVRDGVRYLEMRKSTVMFDAEGQVVESVRMDADRVYLKLHCDFSNHTDKATFFYSINGENWKPIGDTHQMYFDIPHFTGNRVALFYFSTLTTGGHADFDFYRLTVAS